MAIAKLPHALYGKRIAGQVVDAETGAPIPGAHVAFLWESTIIPSGFTGHNSRDICYHAAATVTDRDGEFEVPGWRKWSTYHVRISDPIVLVYVREYEAHQFTLKPQRRPPIDRPSERFRLNRFKGSVDERMLSMWGGFANRGCFYGGESQKSLYPMLKALYEEGRSIARTPGQMNTVHSLARRAARAALAFDPSDPGHDREVEEFIKEQLT
jgi:hypothetical protein